MDSVLFYQVQLQRIYEKLETFLVNEDIDTDNMQLTEE